LPAPSRNNIKNTSKDSPNKQHSPFTPQNNQAGNLQWPPGPSNITTAKCSNSISEVGSEGQNFESLSRIIKENLPQSDRQILNSSKFVLQNIFSE